MKLWMQPIFDNLSYLMSLLHNGDEEETTQQMVSRLIKDDDVELEALTYIRGRSISKQYVVVDEAQNLTPHEVKTIITRAGEGTKLIFTGDVYQIDHPYLDSQSNGLSYLIEKMKGQKLYAHINLEKGERSDLSDLAIQLL